MSADPYHLADGRGSLGVFRRAEVEAGLATGRFAGTVLSWREGEPGWVALASRPEFGAARSAFATLQPATTPAFEVGGRLLARGFLRRCARTWVDVLFRPTATFVPFREPAGIRLAWIWLLLATALAVPLVFFLGQATLTAFLRAIGRSVDVRTAGLNLTYLGKAWLLLPLWASGLTALLTLALHAALRVFAGGAGGWRATFRVIAYLGGAWLLGCVAWCLAISLLIPRAFPVGGGLVGLSGLLGLGFLLTLGRALALAHGDAGWKPGLALVALICLGCCGAAIVIPFVLYPFFAQLGG
jgi:hypothetical protein